MAKKEYLKDIKEEEILWHDRKRIMGLPISFTVYEIDNERFTTRKGFFRTETNEILLYRILDVKLVRTLGQKLVGVGSITLYTADQSTSTFEIKNVKKSAAVRKFISRIVERERAQKGLTGREIYGAAGLIREEDGVAGQEFTDSNNDGIPD
ncbi:MAG: PH domain-containing protein [Christensenellales bacterium]